ncbi:hypothetical protein [Mycobacteroides abscessus]|uniref:hypothetical protein n=1 Tax=Mycobacteroides abscessus TaxID=36809 RepID=UPI0019296138|nr:hypothetical protein [Mycobacteroides abscessus]MBL3752951.1 hypothetical protein [Mycobacteroides abscessus subsp. massiliense]
MSRTGRKSAQALYRQMCSIMGEGRLTAQSARCWICKHSVHARYDSNDGSGCIAAGAAPWTLTGAFDGELPGQGHIGGDGEACLCPGFTAGGLPHEQTKHMDGLDAHEGELCPNPGCEHELARHGEVDFDGRPFGCWACPCTINDMPASSLFIIRVDAAVADALGNPELAVALGSELHAEGGWLMLVSSESEGSVSIKIWERDGIHFRSVPLAVGDEMWSALCNHETIEVAAMITDCWWHQNQCDCSHQYQMRLVVGGDLGFHEP